MSFGKQEIGRVSVGAVFWQFADGFQIGHWGLHLAVFLVWELLVLHLGFFFVCLWLSVLFVLLWGIVEFEMILILIFIRIMIRIMIMILIIMLVLILNMILIILIIILNLELELGVHVIERTHIPWDHSVVRRVGTGENGALSIHHFGGALEGLSLNVHIIVLVIATVLRRSCLSLFALTPFLELVNILTIAGLIWGLDWDESVGVSAFEIELLLQVFGVIL